MNLKPLRLFFHNDDISEMFPNFTNKAAYTHTMTDLYRNSKIIVIIYMQKTNQHTQTSRNLDPSLTTVKRSSDL